MARPIPDMSEAQAYQVFTCRRLVNAGSGTRIVRRGNNLLPATVLNSATTLRPVLA